jgi:hypothetical protein
MNALIFLILLLLAFLLIIGIPAGISYLIYRFLKKKNYDKTLRLLCLIPFLILGFIIFRAVYPSNEFYQEDFKEVTGLDFPNSGEIIDKTASYPDHFDDYTSVSLVRVNKEFYDRLSDHLVVKGFEENREKISSTELNEILGEIDNKEVVKEFSIRKGGGIYYYVGFLSDNESIIIKRLSW